MSKYELAVVVNAQIDDEARAAVVNNCKELVERFGAVNVVVDSSWGKKKLAYPIQKMDEGYYYFVRFEAEGNRPLLNRMLLSRTLNRKQRNL